MKYTGLDPMPINDLAIALSKDGKEKIDLYNACVLVNMQYDQSKLKLTFVKIYDAGPMPNGTQVDIDISVTDLRYSLNGGLNDYSALDYICRLTEDEFILLIGDLKLTFHAEEIKARYTQADEKTWDTASGIYKQTRNKTAKRD